MCRLVGISGNLERADYWLSRAPNSLLKLAEHNRDGAGIGWFPKIGEPAVVKSTKFNKFATTFQAADQARDGVSLLAHVRGATSGAVTELNTHPFLVEGRLWVHNGTVHHSQDLLAELGPYQQLIHGTTDSERFAALATKHIDEHNGDVGAGLVSAARWVNEHQPISALNVVVSHGDEMWALRFPDTRALYMLKETVGDRPSIVLASEPLDAAAGWRELKHGELLHLKNGQVIDDSIAIPEPVRDFIDTAK
jgi:glutamine amidotransferase